MDEQVEIRETICDIEEGLEITFYCLDCKEKFTAEEGDIIYIKDEYNMPTHCKDCAEVRQGIKAKPPSDPINSPPHYTQHPSNIECLDITKHHNFCVGNAIKYLWRAGLKEQKPLYIVNPKKIDLLNLPLVPGEFVKTTGDPKDSITQLASGEDKKSQVEDLNKALFYIMEEIHKLGGEVTARPRRRAKMSGNPDFDIDEHYEKQKRRERRDLRDRFAMAALAGMSNSYPSYKKRIEKISEISYEFADEMLIRRDKISGSLAPEGS